MAGAEATEDDIEMIKRFYDAYNREEFDAVVELVDPEVEVLRVGGFGEIKGRDAFLEFVRPESFESQRIEPRTFEINGDRILAEGVFHGRGAGSGIELSTDLWQVWTIRDGIVVRVESHLERDDALSSFEGGA